MNKYTYIRALKYEIDMVQGSLNLALAMKGAEHSTTMAHAKELAALKAKLAAFGEKAA